MTIAYRAKGNTWSWPFSTGPPRLNTIGLARLVYPDRDVAAELASTGLDSVSVSLVAHNPEVYNQLCRPVLSKAYRAVLKFSEDCRDAGIDVELTVVELPEVDIEACRSIAQRIGAAFRARPLLAPDADADSQ